jgi:hypothetical protein
MGMKFIEKRRVICFILTRALSVFSLNLQSEVLKRGRTYRCLGCEDGKAYEGEKRHVISHYCAICPSIPSHSIVPCIISRRRMNRNLKSMSRSTGSIRTDEEWTGDFLHRSQNVTTPLEGIRKEESAKVYGQRVKETMKPGTMATTSTPASLPELGININAGELVAFLENESSQLPTQESHCWCPRWKDTPQERWID